jgi:hypothetical protein
MPSFTITMGDPLTGRAVRTLAPVEAPTLAEARDSTPHIPGLVILSIEGDAPAPDAKRCGCRPDGLTRNVTLWDCSGCDAIHGARRRRCPCGRSRPAAPAERIYLAPNVARGSFQDRRGITRCVGCLAPE